jgi:hypothetical protein
LLQFCFCLYIFWTFSLGLPEFENTSIKWELEINIL